MIDRIAVIGGSSVYIPELVLSIVSHNLNVGEIALVGRERRKLELVARFCQRLIDRSGFPAKIVATTDLEEGVDGAEYTLNHIRVGGMEARVRDEKTPPRFGMIGDESLGAGGFANAMRTLPVVMDIAKRIEEFNPDTTFINLTNPMGVIVEALIKHSKLKVIGVCDLPGTYVKKVAGLMQKDEKDIVVDFIGLNHMGWIQDVRLNERSCMAKVLSRIEENGVDGFDHELIDLFRMIPTRTTSLYFHADQILRTQKQSARSRAEVLDEAEKQILKLYEDDHLHDIPPLTRQRNAVWYEETILPLILALESDAKKSLILCVENGDTIRDLPDDCSVEVPVTVSRQGLKAERIGNCPHFLHGLFVAVKVSDRLTVEAAMHRSYEYALQALTINPLVPSFESAKKYLDNLIKVEKLELH